MYDKRRTLLLYQIYKKLLINYVKFILFALYYIHLQKYNKLLLLFYGFPHLLKKISVFIKKNSIIF